MTWFEDTIFVAVSIGDQDEAEAIFGASPKARRATHSASVDGEIHFAPFRPYLFGGVFFDGSPQNGGLPFALPLNHKKATL